jgi:hypothetical protein
MFPEYEVRAFATMRAKRFGGELILLAGLLIRSQAKVIAGRILLRFT